MVSTYATLSIGVSKKSEIVEATVEVITEVIFEIIPLFPFIIVTNLKKKSFKINNLRIILNKLLIYKGFLKFPVKRKNNVLIPQFPHFNLVQTF